MHTSTHAKSKAIALCVFMLLHTNVVISVRKSKYLLHDGRANVSRKFELVLLLRFSMSRVTLNKL